MKISTFDKKACAKINRSLNKVDDEVLVEMIVMLRTLIVLNVLPPDAPQYLELSDYLTHEAYRRGIDL